MADSVAAFIIVIALAVVFAVIVAVVVLRFLTVMADMRLQESRDRAELLRNVDASHVQAFTNAMTALESTHSRITNENMAMFNKTMDMVHGPATPVESGAPFAVDNPNLDARPAWMPTDDGDGIEQFIDPTDDNDPWLALGSDVHHDDTNGRAVSVRPGETLIPG